MEYNYPSFYSVLPADVRYDKRLTFLSRILYTEITALLNINGECYANNEYFAKLYDTDIRTIRRSISSLIEFDYIQNYTKNRKRYIKLGGTKMSAKGDKNVRQGGQKCPPLPINNNINNIYGQNGSNDPICDQSFLDKKDKENAFETFWNLYPLKVKKQDTYKKFMKLKSEEIEDLINTLPAVVAYHSQELTKNTPFIPAIPHPSTFINGKRWTDSVYLAKNFLKGRAENSGIDGFDTDKFCEMIMYEDPSVYPFGVEVISRADMTFEETLIFLEHNTVDDLFESLKKNGAA